MLPESVLVLNSSYLPIAKTNFERATILILLDKAFSVKDSDREIRSQYLTIKIPEAIVLKDVNYYEHKVPPPTKKNIFIRDGYKCLRCGEQRRERLSLDHLIPRSRFKKIAKERNLEYGENSYENLACLCKDCNSWKDNRTPEEIGWNIKVGKPVSELMLNWQQLWDMGMKNEA